MIHDGNAWSEAQRMRNLSSHTYDEKLADQVYGFVKNKGDILFQGTRIHSEARLVQRNSAAVEVCVRP
ncbi:MAG: nucleotidyltransferase substrate binding protein [Gammaproteobacteria bacterium]|nr:nucleotidyltransferase substrate binding protein [Gammaproteobacteria bacterium]MBU0850310.1 nucleotidyltransferase substrate binding protein [Gammaproteobacteria bacterium]MBU1267085.1 nucleotidyltransferase substrate binding protein [Gammaproteobacteria bacterium]MBU1529127.1 nucleotidyltransferase substrate binding protein [Gammaproteobacteria bacterium]MBU1781647.1 nucleotidyltransferase substrate binding protein [Gammaproteobacteria bacterium]